jgi:hypothetical protein
MRGRLGDEMSSEPKRERRERKDSKEKRISKL